MAVGQQQVLGRGQPIGESCKGGQHVVQAHGLAHAATVLRQQRRDNQVDAAGALDRAGCGHAAGKEVHEHALAHAVAADDAQSLVADGQAQRLLPEDTAVRQAPLQVVQAERKGVEGNRGRRPNRGAARGQR